MKLDEAIQGLSGVARIVDDLLVLGEGTPQDEADKTMTKIWKHFGDVQRSAKSNLTWKSCSFVRGK